MTDPKTSALPEPVAWHYEWKPKTNNNPWSRDVSLDDPRDKGVRLYRNVEPLYTAEVLQAALDRAERAEAERDEWKGLSERQLVQILENGQNAREWRDRAAAEAALESARKVIEHYESGLKMLATTFYKEDQHQDYAKHVLDTKPTKETGNADT